MNYLRADFDFGDSAETSSAELLGSSLTAVFSFPLVGPVGPTSAIGPSADWTSIINKPSTFSPSSHAHIASEITDSTTAGRALLTAATVQAQRDVLEVFVGVANFAALPTPGVTVASGGSVYTANDTGKVYVWGGSSYVEISPNIKSDWNATSGDAQILNKPLTFPPTMTGLPVELVIACSDETSNLTQGANKVTFRAPYAFSLTGARASVNTAPTGLPLVVDINVSGTSALSTTLSIDASEKTSATAATPVVTLSELAVPDDAEITIDIDQIGSGISGKGLKVVLLGVRL